jgi:hypothetical protein
VINWGSLEIRNAVLRLVCSPRFRAVLRLRVGCTAEAQSFDRPEDDKLAQKALRDARQSGYQAIRLPPDTVRLAGQLRAEIEDGRIAENGPNAPAELDAFSAAVLQAIPDLFEYHFIRVISHQILPLEMVRRDDAFLGDVAEIAHEFTKGEAISSLALHGKKLTFSRYVIEAIIGMPTGMSRIDQDIVKVALKLENEIPLEVDFNGGAGALTRALGRKDVSILHIDTHGGLGGRSIQASRAGEMLHATDIRAPVRVPLVLLFGCEGVGSAQAFGSILHARGAEAVISSFAKFDSFGLTGDPVREQQIYEGFFSALRAGRTIGAALVSLRQAALHEGRASSQVTTLTRLLFVLVGREDIAFAWPKLSGQ